MPVSLLTEALLFPNVTRAEPDGLLAIGGDLSIERLLLAYRSGIFPWYNEDLPILWFAPDPRMVLLPQELRINRSLRKAIRKNPYQLTLDTAFEQVIVSCAKTPRPGQQGTWITQDMKEAYGRLHEYGIAHSVEAWLDDKLVGGLYGVSLGDVFCGESMFAHADNASKIAFVALVQQVQAWGIKLIDCQVHTPHLEHFGGVETPRRAFMQALGHLIQAPTRQGKWSFDEDFTIQV